MTLCKKSVIFVLVLILVSPFCSPKEKKVRDYLTTVQWYPRSPEQLTHMLETFFKNAEIKPIPGKIVGLIGPHAGLGYSGQCAARAYKQLEKLPGLERVILMGISHRGGFYGAAVSDFDYNSTPLGNIPVDTQITAQLAKESLFRKSNSILQDEHSLETHLPFLQYIQKKLKNNQYKIVPILFGYLEKKDFKKMADIIKKYVTPKTLIIASSDFTHYGAGYGYVPFRTNIKENLTRLDMGMIEHIKKLDFDGFYNYQRDTDITMCGFVPVGVLMNIFKENNCKAALIDYYKSGDRGNDYSFSVSYASLIISKESGKTSVKRSPGKAFPGPKKTKENIGDKPMSLNLKEKKTLLSIARKTLEDHFQGNYVVLKEVENNFPITPGLKEKAGVFVTLRKQGDLRGCIGSIVGEEPLWEGVRNNVLKSAFRDPRFYPLKEDELEKIDIEISVMTPLQQINDYKKIQLGTDGVIIRKGYHQAVYLPQVATETGWDLDQFLGHLCQKAGLPANEYKSKDIEFHIFQALVFDEKEMETHK
ncbi:MAG: AmmeMemoRadiSam system protein B [Candidatus Aminicenantes bacterium]|nr:MAG: AmmeMemoRadiSam system protein B [Candidatus Aminicenantes bacterium]